VPPDDVLDAAAAAIDAGKLVVYPTETVYGLGADALDERAVDSVFAAKGRPRDNPLSLATPSVSKALEYVTADEWEVAFMRAFLPGPVTVVCEKRDVVPDTLTAGRDRVGVRVPDHGVARALLKRTHPITATSANLTGHPSVRHPRDLDAGLRDMVAVVLDGGETPGAESTVVDVGQRTILRRGALATEVETWLRQVPE
jgi:L-threonylcarbamoyladenylate synthase